MRLRRHGRHLAPTGILMLLSSCLFLALLLSWQQQQSCRLALQASLQQRAMAARREKQQGAERLEGEAEQPERHKPQQSSSSSSSSKYPRLINFAHNCCQKAKERNCRSGLEHGFRSCQSYSLADIAQAALSPSGKAVLGRPRGAGYWIWKPLIVWQNLLEAEDGDVIMYADTASAFLTDAAPLLRLTQQQDVVGFALNGDNLQEFQWTKRDTFRILGAEALERTQQVATSFVIVRRSVASLSFVSQWLTYAQDARALTDDGNTLGADNFPGFHDHRHDQSVFSLLYKKWNLTAFADPTQWGNDISSRPYPQVINHHRLKD